MKPTIKKYQLVSGWQFDENREEENTRGFDTEKEAEEYFATLNHIGDHYIVELKSVIKPVPIKTAYTVEAFV